MKKFLLAIGWLSLVGSILDLLLALLAAAIAFFDPSQDWSLSTEVLFREYIPWLYWVKQLAYLILPDAFVVWIFALSAIGLFLVRAVVSALVGRWAFNAARRYA